MRILGIDPGLQTTGFGIIDAHGQQLRYVASGTIRTRHLSTKELAPRLKVLFEGIHEVITHYAVETAAIEIVFVNVNPQATLLLGQARGACLTALATKELDVAEYTALQMKQAITGYGKAAKEQVQEMVKRILSLSQAPSSDAADALGIAITHAHAMASRKAIIQSQNKTASSLDPERGSIDKSSSEASKVKLPTRYRAGRSS